MKKIVLPINYPDDLEAIMAREKCNAIGIEQVSITYTQPADTNSPSDEVQHLTITTDMPCAATEDEPEAFYFNITIPDGEHWSIDDGNSLKALIEDFKKRLYLKTEYDTERKDSE